MDAFKIKVPERFEPEANLISTIVDDDRRLLEVYDSVSASDFSQEAFSAAWGWFHELHRAGKRINLYTLKQHYGTTSDFEQLQQFLRTLADGVMPFLVKQYAADVRRHALRVRAQTEITRLALLADNATGPEEIQEGVRELFDSVCSVMETGKARKASEIVKDIEEAIANPSFTPRFPTGFPDLDKMINGGLKEGQLIIIAGRTGGGKTVLAMNIAVNAAKAGTPVVAFSLEMSAQDLVMRSIWSEGVGRGEQEAFDIVRNLPLYVDDSSNITARGITAKIKLLASRFKAKVFVVDYLQLLGTDGGSKDTRERIVADMSRSLKICAKETGVAIIALSQVNESGELRESRAIEQDADLVLHVVDVPETMPDPRNRNGPRIETGDYNFFLRVSKQRGGRAHGPISRAKAGAPGIPLNFDGPNFKFTEA